jgi:predicted nuclease of restriction endonuclease-like (RecB) superfamily
MTSIIDNDYFITLNEIKEKIRNSQIKATISVNKELIKLYLNIGKIIVDKQKNSNWGDSIISILSKDLMSEFPNMKGFSRSNLFNMRKFYLCYSSFDLKVQQLVGQLPWGHNIILIDKIKNKTEIEFYVSETIRNNWSRNTLINQIENNLFQRSGKVISNFNKTLPKSQSDLAVQTIKDPYIFDFLEISNKAKEIEIENKLVDNITKFLLELGVGFSYVGKQYHLEVESEDFYIDLLFYHLKLRCFIAIELKSGRFKPEYIGKLNFYLSALDKLKHKNDNSSIGLLLCKEKNKIVAEYSLKDISKPIGVSQYKLSRKLLKSLPTEEELEKIID